MKIRISPARIAIDPASAAIVREYCDKTNTSYSDFIRISLHYVLANSKKIDSEEFPSQRKVYGTLSPQPFIVLLSRMERLAIECFAEERGFGRPNRSYSRVLRGATLFSVQHILKGGKLGQYPLPNT